MARKPLSERPSKKTKEEDTLEKQRLKLEVKEREWNTAWGKFIPLLTPIILAFSIVVSGYWYTNQWELQNKQQMLETERLRQETVASLKKELVSDNPAIRIGAALALSEYPKEAVQVLISSLGDADITFTNTVKHSLVQIGKDAVTPMIEELRNIQRIIQEICLEDINLKEPKGLFTPDYLSVFIRRYGKNIEKPYSRYSITLQTNTYTLLNKPEELRDRLRNSLLSPLSEKAIEVRFPKEEVEYVANKLRDVSSSRPGLKILWKNTLDVLGFLLCKYDIKNLDLSLLDLSGIDLRGAGLSEALLLGSNLSNACLNFADLSGTEASLVKLSGAELINAKLSGAKMSFSDLSQANLRKADLSGADLQRANLSGTFLNGANLTGANLSDANLSNAILRERSMFPWDREELEKYKTNLVGTNLERANLNGVVGFRDIVDFNKTNLKGVTDLSKEDLEYARSKGAIID